MGLQLRGLGLEKDCGRVGSGTFGAKASREVPQGLVLHLAVTDFLS